MISKDFALAGRAIFTIENPKGERYTFRIKEGKKTPGRPACFFGGILTGSDNTNDYRFVGIVDAQTMRLRATAKGLASTAQAFKTLDWLLMVVDGKRTLPEGYKVFHAGRCGRCGRLLTVPESIISGIGPECARKM